jgi:hypothetical protein
MYLTSTCVTVSALVALLGTREHRRSFGVSIGMRTTVSTRLGICAILFAAVVFAGGTFWVETRTLNLVDMPVSLSKGRFMTGTFAINVYASYWIAMDLPHDIAPDCRIDSLRWRRVSHLEELPVHNQLGGGARTGKDVVAGPIFDSFDGKPGRYNIEFEILSADGCLNAGKPRLIILASPSDFAKWENRYAWVCLISFPVGGVGLALLFIGMKSSSRQKAADNQSLSTLGTPLTEYFPGPLKVNPVAAFPFLSQIGLLYSSILLLLIVPATLVFAYAWGLAQPRYGLYVLTDLSPIMKSHSCGEAWVVRIDKKEKWYLNKTKTAPAELPGLLRRQLVGETKCAVYLDVDPSLDYEVAIHAIDAIQSTQVKAVVLLTPGTKNSLPN